MRNGDKQVSSIDSMHKSGLIGQKNEKIDFLCFDLSVLSRSTLFVVLSVITFAFFLVYGYLQELLFELDGFDDHSWFLTLVQFGFYGIFAFGETVVRQDRERK